MLKLFVISIALRKNYAFISLFLFFCLFFFSFVKLILKYSWTRLICFKLLLISIIKITLLWIRGHYLPYLNQSVLRLLIFSISADFWLKYDISWWIIHELLAWGKMYPESDVKICKRNVYLLSSSRIINGIQKCESRLECLKRIAQVLFLFFFQVKTNQYFLILIRIFILYFLWNKKKSGNTQFLLRKYKISVTRLRSFKIFTPIILFNRRQTKILKKNDIQ